jgi:hypothetical protein
VVPPHPSRMAVQADLFGEYRLPLGWTGGGSFTFYVLGQAIVGRDTTYGFWRLNYGNGELVEAVCMSKGFRLTGYDPIHGVKGLHFAHVTDIPFTSKYAAHLLSHPRAEGEYLTVYSPKIDLDKDTRLPSYVDAEQIPHALHEATTYARVTR